MIQITNTNNTRSGQYDGFSTNLLIGEINTGSDEISIQITDVLPNKMQTIHSHPQSQCYYIIEGTGKVIINQEEMVVTSGDAIFIPGGSEHGIMNVGDTVLKYLTANRAFGLTREKEIWYEDYENAK